MLYVAKRITDKLTINKIILPDDRELYLYGFHQGLLFLLNMLTIFLLGYICGMIKESIVFFMAYMPLRSNAGGYHGKTPLICYIISVLMIFVVFAAINLPFWNTSATATLTTAAVLTIALLAPVEDLNKPFDAKEKMVFRKRSIKLLSFICSAGILLWSVGQKTFAICMVMALTMAALMLIAGRVKNKRIIMC